MEHALLCDKLKLGINGLEWLVLQTNVTDEKKKSLDQYVNLAGSTLKKNITQLFIDAVNMDSDTFYETHELNWWIAIDETITFLSILKQQDYNGYLYFLNKIYSGGCE
ncbi:hypothetical protein TS65_09900 [Aneurinibacillus migulanus]|nr:hypothetical protein TS65_09900 [Aneurinibacillus migulanus]